MVHTLSQTPDLEQGLNQSMVNMNRNVRTYSLVNTHPVPTQCQAWERWWELLVQEKFLEPNQSGLKLILNLDWAVQLTWSSSPIYR